MAKFDMLLAVSGRLGPVESVAGGRVECPMSLATAGPAGGHPLRPRATNRDHLAPRRRSQPRLPRQLIVPGGTRTQDRICRHSVARFGASNFAAAGSIPGGHRRHAHQTLRSEGRRGRHPSQSHAGDGRPKVSLRAYLGDALAGRAASAIWCFGLSIAGYALRSPQNDGQDSQVAGTVVFSPTGRGE